jgi:hypothetical protein
MIEPEDDEDTYVSAAVRWLKDNGASEASEYGPQATEQASEHTWYSTAWDCIDLRTGEEEQRSFHLSGFTPEEYRAIYAGVIGKGAK